MATPAKYSGQERLVEAGRDRGMIERAE